MECVSNAGTKLMGLTVTIVKKDSIEIIENQSHIVKRVKVKPHPQGLFVDH